MKKSLLACLTAVCLLLTGCGYGGASQAQQSKTLTVACTAWPVYCFTQAVADGADGVDVVPIITDVVSCIHDYTLTVTNMKVIARADLLVINGAGLEENMESALETSGAPVVDASQGVSLLTMIDDGEEETDPHIWMDPARAQQMVQNICDGLCEADPANEALYRANCDSACQRLQACLKKGREALSGLSCRELINFHDGFSYFAQAFDLTILDAIEEEAGSEASAKDIVRVCDEVETHGLPAIFVEANGSDATAKVIARETGCRIGTLSMIMSDNGSDRSGLDYYLWEMDANFNALLEAMQ